MSEPDKTKLISRISNDNATSALKNLCQAAYQANGGKFPIFIYDTRFSGYVLVDQYEHNSPEIFNLRKIYQAHGSDLTNNWIEKRRGEMTVCVANTSTPEALEILDFIPFIYNRIFTNRVLFNVNRSVDFADHDKFFSEMALIVSSSSGMERGAFRRLDSEGYLRADFSWNLDGIIVGDKLRQWDCAKEENEIFYNAMKPGGGPQQCQDMKSSYPSFFQRPEQSDIVSYCAVPVNVAGNVEGVLSVAQCHTYYFSEPEQQGILTIANAVGVAIANYENFLKSKHESAAKEKDASAATAVEAAQSIRHEIILSAGMITSLSNLLERDRNQKVEFSKQIKRLNQTATSIHNAVDRLRDVMDFERKLEFTDFKSVVNDCIASLRYKLNEMKIDITVNGKARKMYLIPNVLRIIIHNLILNSIDSFEYSRKSNRKIFIEFEIRNWEIVCRYFDNGIGIDRDQISSKIIELEAPKSILRKKIESDDSNDQKEAVFSAIFRERLTTKLTGSGYGLFLARKMAKYHGKGTIEFIEPSDKKWSVGFRFEVSSDLKRIFDANKKLVINIERDKKVNHQKILEDVFLEEDFGCELVFPREYGY